MKYLDFSNTYGNMSNHFYLAYQAYYYSKLTGEPVRYIRNKAFYDFGIQKIFGKFNMEDLSISPDDVKNTDTIVKNTDHPLYRYHQCIFKDFIIENIEKFVSDTFLCSDIFKNSVTNTTDIGIHIRNKDFLNNVYDCFDRVDYISKCLRLVSNTITTLQVFSDDIDLCIEKYDDIFTKRFDSIVYRSGTTSIDDFVTFANMKNKILWNSTFSYWAGFIGNVIHNDSYDCVFAPARFASNEPLCNHINPLWNIINI